MKTGLNLTHLPVVLLLALLGCKTQQQTVEETIVVEADRAQSKRPARIPDWAPKNHGYKPSATKAFNLLHTRLEVHPDWQRQWLPGVATLTLVPHFYPQDSLILDAKGLSINRVVRLEGGRERALSFSNTGQHLRIALDRRFARTDTLQVLIDYVAKPNELSTQGSEAIFGAKGLYFINPTGTDSLRPQQLWTQGETESSSCWFPTLDAPNQRCTQDLLLTVDSALTTLSNGRLVNSTLNPDGTRTDHWKMDRPHAPYLFMMAVGRFAVLRQQWQGREVSYYLDPEYAPWAQLVFGNTPEMIDFFSNRLGVPFPWAKYSQVVVHDFVSGAMENTTATVHMAALQHDDRAHLDDPHEDYISHELFHQWFGDLVTCEAWSNITLNEAFASYGEVLWREHKYGPLSAQMHLDEQLETYLLESFEKREPLIRFHYKQREDVFDAHSYQKGSRILHMLRHELGDDAFFAALNLYLTRHAYTDVEVDELRLAFEDLTGRDLRPWFEQWFLKPGHPELDLTYSLRNDSLVVQARQEQDIRYLPTYDLKLDFALHTAAGIRPWTVELNTTDTSWALKLPEGSSSLLNVEFDPQAVLLARVSEHKPRGWWMEQYARSTHFRGRKLALRNLKQDVDQPEVLAVFERALADPSPALRSMALSEISASIHAGSAAVVQRMKTLLRDPVASVRTEAVYTLTGLLETLPGLLADIRPLLRDSSYEVTAAALLALFEAQPQEAVAEARRLSTTRSGELRQQCAEIFLYSNTPGAVDYCIGTLRRMDNPYGKMGLLVQLGKYTSENAELPEAARGLSFLKETAQHETAFFLRLAAVQALLQCRATHEGVEDFLSKLKENEADPRLREMYGNMF